MKNTKKEKVKLSEEFHSLVNTIRDLKWDEVELQLHSPQIKCLNERELFLAFYTTVLVACHKIPASNPLIPSYILSIFETLFGLGIDINTISPQGTTALTYASKKFQPELVRYFIDKKADVNISTCFGSPIIELCKEASGLVRTGDFSNEEIELHRPLVMQTARIL
ncbi:MAG: hypothetical protein LBF88_10855, partial [Planctomycetaceae bacterium]|nr:hypothetical protein [Planctomycetaceae bacterium]